MNQTEELIETISIAETEDVYDLIVFNDDFNTFEHVIETLIRVCKHDPIQAEQCTLIIHFNGKCSVKKGSFDELKPQHTAILDAGIGAAIF